MAVRLVDSMGNEEKEFGEYYRLGKEVRELMHVASLIKGDIGKYKSVEKRVKFHPRDDSKPVYLLMYKLDFRICQNWSTSGHSFWSALDSACSKDCDGKYEIVSFNWNDSDPNRQELPKYEVLGPEYHMTQKDYRTILEYCERLNKWVDDSLAVISSSKVRNDRKSDGRRYAKSYKLIIQKLIDHVRPLI